MSARFRLVLISPDAHGPRDVARLETLLPGLAVSADLLVLRWTGSTSRELVQAARRLAAVHPRPRLLLRDRFDLARAAELEGVQLPEDGMLPMAIRSCWSEAIIGVSRHDAPEEPALPALPALMRQLWVVLRVVGNKNDVSLQKEGGVSET